ncbi:unnamed protein product [Peronospora belbahrii]|uniref:SRCR domain-containing protein n=1 Tax=Peronospora belbahrii TaxID=622444 RepID=A0ABN8CQE9_9STRA|nr:unnamed protein product [Peronospora belbahrii]
MMSRYFWLCIVLSASYAVAVEVSVCQDATYDISVDVKTLCAGAGSKPTGWNCPKAGDVAVVDCLSTLASFKSGSCVAPEDAVCEVVNGNTWGCVLPSVGCNHTLTEKVVSCETWDYSGDMSGDSFGSFDGNEDYDESWFMKTTELSKLTNCGSNPTPAPITSTPKATPAPTTTTPPAPKTTTPKATLAPTTTTPSAPKTATPKATTAPTTATPKATPSPTTRTTTSADSKGCEKEEEKEASKLTATGDKVTDTEIKEQTSIPLLCLTQTVMPESTLTSTNNSKPVLAKCNESLSDISDVGTKGNNKETKLEDKNSRAGNSAVVTFAAADVAHYGKLSDEMLEGIAAVVAFAAVVVAAILIVYIKKRHMKEDELEEEEEENADDEDENEEDEDSEGEFQESSLLAPPTPGVTAGTVATTPAAATAKATLPMITPHTSA